MNLWGEQLSLNYAASRKQIPIGISKMSMILVAAIIGWCGAIKGAEIHEAAELGDLARVKACLARDPKQINTADVKGRTVLACAVLGGKSDIVESCRD